MWKVDWTRTNFSWRAAAHPQVRVLLSQLLFYLIRNKSCFFFSLFFSFHRVRVFSPWLADCLVRDFPPGYPVRFNELNATTRVSEPSGCRG